MNTEIINTKDSLETSLIAPTSTELASAETINQNRRRISKAALWTPPVMMTLMLSSRNSAASVTQEPAPAAAPDTWGGY